MKRATDPRHLARILALQELFSKYFNPDSLGTEDIPVQDLVTLNEFEEYNEDLFNGIIQGVPEKIGEIDELIKKYAPQWPISQMKLVDLQILRIAIYEGFISDLTPPKVAIDEAIETAREFGGEVSSKFINGVLGAIYEETNKKNG